MYTPPPLPKLLLTWCSALLSALSNREDGIEQLHEYYLMQLSRLYFDSQQLTKCLLSLFSLPDFVEFDSSPQNTSPNRQALVLVMQFLQRRNVLNRTHWEIITDVELNRPLRVKIFEFLHFYAVNKDKKGEEKCDKRQKQEEVSKELEQLSKSEEENEEYSEEQIKEEEEKVKLKSQEEKLTEIEQQKRERQILNQGWLKFLGREPWSIWHCLIRSRICHPAIALLSLLFKRAFQILPLAPNNIHLFQQYSRFVAQHTPLLHDPHQQTHRLCFEESFEQMVRSHSLRMNPRLWNQAMKQIKQLVSLIRFSSPELRTLNWELYGSIATGLALQVQSDADINLVLEGGGEMHRQKQLEWLKRIYESLQFGAKLEKKLGKPLKLKFYCSPRIKLPFLKLRMFHNPHGPKNSLKILRSYDIIINNTQAVRHVLLFRPYLESGRIARFLMLVKIWAKRRNIINVFQHIYCYSSHFISIMAAFYLINAGYAPYLKEEGQQFVVTSPLIPDHQLPPLAELFRGFLTFYRKEGQFNSQNLTISLVQDYPPWSEEKGHLCALNWSLSLVRIYDCVTKTNRGKIEHKHKQNFYKQVEDTLIKVQNLASIEQIIYLPAQDL